MEISAEQLNRLKDGMVEKSEEMKSETVENEDVKNEE